LDRQVTPSPPDIPSPKAFSKRRLSSSARKKSQDPSSSEAQTARCSTISKLINLRIPPPPQAAAVTPPQKSKKTTSGVVATPSSSSKKNTKKSDRKKPKAPLKQKRSRRKDPMVKKFVSKTNLDVLLGRGGCSNHHPGNEVYRRHILGLQKKYKELSREEKTEFSREAVECVRDRGGRFLNREFKGGPWYIVTDVTARQKVSQALREDHTPEGRALKKSKTESKKK
jgi:hypothetical protein